MPVGVYIRTAEGNANISKAMTGRKQSKETCKKRSKSMIGKNTGPRSAEACANIRKAVIKYYKEHPEVLENMSKIMKGLWQDPAWYANQVKVRKKQWQDPEFYAKMVKSQIKYYKEHPEACIEQSVRLKKRIKNMSKEEYAEYAVRWTNNHKPGGKNGRFKTEEKLEKILDELSMCFYFEFTGSGPTLYRVDTRCPDFIDNKHKLIIEMFGYHHREKHRSTKKNDFTTDRQHANERKRYFKKYGWETLIIWQCELKNTKKLKKKLITFVNKNKLKKLHTNA